MDASLVNALIQKGFIEHSQLLELIGSDEEEVKAVIEDVKEFEEGFRKKRSSLFPNSWILII